MSFECSFSAKGIDYDLWIDDDGRVCYAYIFDADGKICGNVWLYNRGPAPDGFEDGRGVPPRNPKQFVTDAQFSPPKSPDEISAQWHYEGEVLYARVFIRKSLFAILAPGTRPGWCVLAKSEGPVAKVLEPSSPSNLSEIMHDLRAIDGEAEDPADREHDDVMEEMTATDHRERTAFKEKHPHPERRIPKEERRRIRIEHRAAWAHDWNEGRFKGLPRLGPSPENRTRNPVDRPIKLRPDAPLDEVLAAIADELYGTTATANDIRLMRERLSPTLVPNWLAEALQRYKLAGTSFNLTDEQDLSGLGADVIWFTPKQMIGRHATWSRDLR